MGGIVWKKGWFNSLDFGGRTRVGKFEQCASNAKREEREPFTQDMDDRGPLLTGKNEICVTCLIL